VTGQGEGKLQLSGGLRGVFRRAVEFQYIYLRDLVFARIAVLSSLIQYALNALSKLSSGEDSSLLLLSVRWRSADSLAVALRNSRLRNSRISRPLNLRNISATKFDYFTSGDHWKLKFVRPNLIRKSIFNNVKEQLLCA